MSYVLGIEPTAATAIDLRTGKYASRPRAPYPRSLVNLAGILREPQRACEIARLLKVDAYPVDASLPIEMVIHDRLATNFEYVENISAREEDYSGPVTYYQGIRYGECARDTADFVRSHPEGRIVAIPAIFSGSRTEVVETARIIKETNPDLLVVVGGTYASTDPMFLLQSGWIDVVVMGEAWLTFPALVHIYLNTDSVEDVPGILYRTKTGEIVDSTSSDDGFYPLLNDYDIVPIPAWDLLDFKAYDAIGLTHAGETSDGNWVAPIDSEIGCGLKCKFCAAGFLNAGRLVKKSAHRLFDEVRYLAEDFGRNRIQFDSDNPLVDNARSIEFFHLLKDYNRERARRGDEIVRFEFPNGTAPWTFRDPQMIPIMLEAGLSQISIAVESGSPKTLRTLGKSPKVPALARKAIDQLRHWERQVRRPGDMPLVIEVFIMLGAPGETEKDVEETLRYCRELSRDFDVIFAPFYYAPLHGTPLFSSFFEENPKATKLAWPVLGWLGTEKKDKAVGNAILRQARETISMMSRTPMTAGLVRL